MGRGAKSGHARKERRKDARETKKSGKSTVIQRDKKKHAKQTLIGGIPTISMTEADENTILDILASMRYNRGEFAGVVDTTTLSLERLSLESEQQKYAFDRSVFVRKLVRDERALCRRLEELKKVAKAEMKADRAAARLKRIADMQTQGADSTPVAELSRVPSEIAKDTLLPMVTKALKTLKSRPLPPTVRLSVSCESKASTPDKLIIFDRSQPLEALIQQARNKFAVTKKFDCLLLLASKTIMTASDLLQAVDGMLVRLTFAYKYKTMSKPTGGAVAVEIEKKNIECNTEFKFDGKSDGVCTSSSTANSCSISTDITSKVDVESTNQVQPSSLEHTPAAGALCSAGPAIHTEQEVTALSVQEFESEVVEPHLTRKVLVNRGRDEDKLTTKRNDPTARTRIESDRDRDSDNDDDSDASDTGSGLDVDDTESCDGEDSSSTSSSSSFDESDDSGCDGDQDGGAYVHATVWITVSVSLPPLSPPFIYCKLFFSKNISEHCIS